MRKMNIFNFYPIVGHFGSVVSSVVSSCCLIPEFLLGLVGKYGKFFPGSNEQKALFVLADSQLITF